jgi:hypothetical protein
VPVLSAATPRYAYHVPSSQEYVISNVNSSQLAHGIQEDQRDVRESWTLQFHSKHPAISELSCLVIVLSTPSQAVYYVQVNL